MRRRMVASCSAINCTNSRKNGRRNVTFHRYAGITTNENAVVDHAISVKV
jgi:hypothetical protein